MTNQTATQTVQAETQTEMQVAANWMDTMATMITRVEKNGKNLYVVVPDIKAFKEEAVTRLTKRDNKRRTPEGRFEWLLKTYLRANYDMKGKHMKVHLMSGKAEGPYADHTGHFIKIDLDNLNVEAEKEANSDQGHAKVKVVKAKKEKKEKKEQAQPQQPTAEDQAALAEAEKVAAELVTKQEVESPEVLKPMGKNGKPLTGAALVSWKKKFGQA